MALTNVLDLVGTIALLGYAVASLFFPKWVAKFIAQVIDTPRGVAEFRIVNGGFFLGMAIFALVTNQPVVYGLLGMGWLGAAGARLLSVALDRPPLNATYIIGFAAETALGIMMIV